MGMLAFLPQSLLVPARGCLCLVRSPQAGTSPLPMASPSQARPPGPDPGPAAIDRQLPYSQLHICFMLRPSELHPWGCNGDRHHMQRKQSI